MFDTSQLTGLLMQSMDPMQLLARNMLTNAAEGQATQTIQGKAAAILEIEMMLSKAKESGASQVTITSLEKLQNRLSS